MTTTQLRCDVCGKFISFKELDEGTARHQMITPDSARSSEDWESLCAKCNTPENRQ